MNFYFLFRQKKCNLGVIDNFKFFLDLDIWDSVENKKIYVINGKFSYC